MGSERDDELRSLVHRWRSRSEIFSEEDAVARRTANLCADELEDILDEREGGDGKP